MAGSCTGQQPYHASIREGRELDCKGELRFTGHYNFPLSAGYSNPFFQANDCQFNGSEESTVFDVFMPSAVIVNAKYHVCFSKIHTTNSSNTHKSGTVTLIVDKLSVQPPLSTAWQECPLLGQTMRMVLTRGRPSGCMTIPAWIMFLSAAHAQITRSVKKRRTQLGKTTTQHSLVSAETNAVPQVCSDLDWLLHAAPCTAAFASCQCHDMPSTQGNTVQTDQRIEECVDDMPGTQGHTVETVEHINEWVDSLWSS